MKRAILTMFAAALSGFLVLLLGFTGAGLAILFHLNRYAVPGDSTPRVRLVFLAGNIFFLAIALIAFFLVPWDAIRLR